MSHRCCCCRWQQLVLVLVLLPPQHNRPSRPQESRQASLAKGQARRQCNRFCQHPLEGPHQQEYAVKFFIGSARNIAREAACSAESVSCGTFSGFRGLPRRRRCAPPASISAPATPAGQTTPVPAAAFFTLAKNGMHIEKAAKEATMHNPNWFS